MNWAAFDQKIPKDVPFTVEQVQIYFPENDLKGIRQNLFNWQKARQVTKLRKNLYVIKTNDVDLRLVANKVYEPSYVSLQYALSYYGLIPEAVFAVTSVSPNKTARFRNELGSFIYQHVKQELYFGYHYVDNFLIAEREKCFLDYFYLNLSKVCFEKSYLRELRLQSMEKLDAGKLKDYLVRFKVKKLANFVNFCLNHHA